MVINTNTIIRSNNQINLVNLNNNNVNNVNNVYDVNNNGP